MNYIDNLKRKNNFFVIQQSETYFKVEKIPQNLSFFEKLRFSNTVKDSINGLVIKTHETFGHIVHIYVKAISVKTNFCSILLEKIRALLCIIGESVTSEVWVVKEKSSYSCFGVVEDEPVFYKSFSDISYIGDEVIRDMCDQMGDYCDVSCVRVFGCSLLTEGVGVEVYEYSSDFIMNKIGCVDINEYCIKEYLNRLRENKFKYYLLALNLFISACSICIFSRTQRITSAIKQLQIEVLEGQ